jgi:hypothetical protein
MFIKSHISGFCRYLIILNLYVGNKYLKHGNKPPGKDKIDFQRAVMFGQFVKSTLLFSE